MPVYEYHCPACSYQYEKREGFDAPARQKCPNCGKRARRVFHAASVVFKGSGFYVTDSRDSHGGTEASTSAEPSTNSSESTTSSDSGSKDTEAAAAS